MGACCPWKREAFTYRGLCNHNALADLVKGEFDVTKPATTTTVTISQPRPKKYNCTPCGFHNNERLRHIHHLMTDKHKNMLQTMASKALAILDEMMA